MKFVEHKLATGAMLTGYLRDETTEMPSYNTRPAVLILPGGGYRYCSSREADPVAVQFLQAGYHVFTLIYSTDHAPLLWQPLTEAASAILYLRRNAADLRIAADKITIVGFSAGAHLAASTALLQTMSLENQVRPDVPPFFIWHTVEDQAVPVENSLLLAGALKENNVPFELHLFTHGGHGSSTCTNEVNTPNKHNNAWLPLCMGWLGETLDFTL